MTTLFPCRQGIKKYYTIIGITALIVGMFLVLRQVSVTAQTIGRPAIPEETAFPDTNSTSAFNRSVLILGEECTKKTPSSSAKGFCFQNQCVPFSDWKASNLRQGTNNLGFVVKNYNDDDCDNLLNYQDECPTEHDKDLKGSQYNGCPVEKPYIYNARNIGGDRVNFAWSVRGDAANGWIANASGIIEKSFTKTKDNYEESFNFQKTIGETASTYTIWIENKDRNIRESRVVQTTDTRDLKDSDGDGRIDIEDSCPNEAAPNRSDGCPLRALFLSTRSQYGWLDPIMDGEVTSRGETTMRGKYFMLEVETSNAQIVETNMKIDTGYSGGPAKIIRRYCNDTGFSNIGVYSTTGRYCRFYILPPQYDNDGHITSATLHVSIQGEDRKWKEGIFRMGMQQFWHGSGDDRNGFCLGPFYNSCDPNEDKSEALTGNVYVCGSHEERGCDDVVSVDNSSIFNTAGASAADSWCRANPFLSFKGRHGYVVGCNETCMNFPGLSGSGDCITYKSTYTFH